MVELDVVADQPDEDLLALYSHHKVRTPRANMFWGELAGAEAEMDARNLEGYEEEFKRIMAAVPPEHRVAGLTPEQLLPVLPDEVLRGLSAEYLSRLPPEQVVLGLPDEVLRGLSADYLSRLPAETLAAIRRRLGHA